MAKFTIGPLVCSGSKSEFVVKSEIENLKHQLSQLHTESEQKMDEVISSVSTLDSKVTITSNEISSLKLKVDRSENKVIFQAFKSDGGNFHDVPKITYNQVPINIGDSMDGATGIFTTEIPGTYAFSFSGQTGQTKSNLYLQVHKNAKFFLYISDYDDDSTLNNISFNWLMTLSIGDTVYIKVPYGHYLYAGSDYHLSFSGFLIKSEE